MRLSLTGIVYAFLLCVAVTTNSAVAASLGVDDVWVLRDDTFKTWLQKHIGPYKGAQVLFQQKAKGLYDVEVVPYTSKTEQVIWKEAAYPNNAFMPYLTHPQSALFATKHSLLIRSMSGNFLVIPQKSYVTLAGFLNKATAKRFVDAVGDHLRGPAKPRHHGAHDGAYGLKRRTDSAALTLPA